MASVFEYMGVRDGNSWTFQRQIVVEIDGEAYGFPMEVQVFLSDDSVSLLSNALEGFVDKLRWGGRNWEEIILAAAVSEIMNSRPREQKKRLIVADQEVIDFVAGN